MRAVGRSTYGDASVLRLDHVGVPSPAPGEVLVRVRAASLDRGAWHIMKGEPYVMRLAGFGTRRPKRFVIGSDLAGDVVAVGEGVTGVRVGDEVFGGANGSFAEFVATKERNLAPKPASMTFEQAACVPVSALTALQALRDKARAEAGQRVLVVGASGGVGTFAVQIALSMGLHVTAVCHSSKVEFVRGLGAHEVIAYDRADITSAGTHDAVLDIGGSRSIRHLRRCLTPTGTAVIVGGEDMGRWFGLGRQVRALLTSPFVKQRFVVFVAATNRPDLEVLTAMVERGELTSAVDRVVPLEGLPEAMRAMEAGTLRGKVAVAVAVDQAA